MKQANVPEQEFINEEEFNDRNEHDVNSQSFVKAKQKYLVQNSDTFASNVK